MIDEPLLEEPHKESLRTGVLVTYASILVGLFFWIGLGTQHSNDLQVEFQQQQLTLTAANVEYQKCYAGVKPDERDSALIQKCAEEAGLIKALREARETPSPGEH